MRRGLNERFATLIRQIGKETNELTSKGGEIQKVITEINRDFEERNFAGVIKSIRLQLSESKNNIVTLLKAIKEFNDQNSMGLGVCRSCSPPVTMKARTVRQYPCSRNLLRRSMPARKRKLACLTLSNCSSG
jgi:hypothetical protein